MEGSVNGGQNSGLSFYALGLRDHFPGGTVPVLPHEMKRPCSMVVHLFAAVPPAVHVMVFSRALGLWRGPPQAPPRYLGAHFPPSPIYHAISRRNTEKGYLLDVPQVSADLWLQRAERAPAVLLLTCTHIHCANKSALTFFFFRGTVDMCTS